MQGRWKWSGGRHKRILFGKRGRAGSRVGSRSNDRTEGVPGVSVVIRGDVFASKSRSDNGSIKG